LDRYFNDEKTTETPREEENKERNKNETISLTSEFYQIFIDDLNGIKEEFCIIF